LITSLTVVRTLHFASILMLEGALIFRFLVAEPSLRNVAGEAPPVRLLYRFLAWTVWCGLLVGFASGAAWLVLLAGRIVHLGPLQALYRGIASTVLTRTQFGEIWQLRSILAVLLAGSVIAFDRTAIRPSLWGRMSQLALAIALVGTLAWAGHGAATLGAIGYLQLVGDVLHLVVAGIWVGGLLPLAVMLALMLRAGEGPWMAVANDATRRFSILGIVSVATLILTGLVNTYVLAGSIPALVGTPYGRLLLLKIALFLTMVAIAAVNRQYLTPRLAFAGETMVRHRALAGLVRNSLTEFTLGILTLGIVGVLGTLTPGLHEQPVWPFPIRFSADAFEDPELRVQTLGAVAGIAFAALAAIAAIWVRRWRWALIVGAILVAGYFAPGLENLTETAYPTSFYGSPTGYSAKSIALGHNIFLEHCALCHGAQARGDGPAAQSLPIKPADLTAEHIYGHADGDLFWWIGHGIGQAMPAFGDVLNDDARWNLIDFIHANADAVRLRAAAGRVTGFGYPLPNFSVECPNGLVTSTDQLKGRILHLTFAGQQPVNAPPASANVADKNVVRIIVAPDLETGDAKACVATDPSVRALFGIYRAGSLGDSSGTQWLVDAAGALRAVWWPGHGKPWTGARVLQRRLDQLSRIRAVVRTSGGHAHHH